MTGDSRRGGPGPVATRISIVTPSCNQAKFVGETIESVLSQEGDFEIEYSVMDGGSTDGSVDIIRRYADLVASGGWPVRCRGITMSWVSERDAGQTAAINAGLRHATGDIFSYINSDDLYFRGAFQRVVEAFAARSGGRFRVRRRRRDRRGGRPSVGVAVATVQPRRHDVIPLALERLHELHPAAGHLLAPAGPRAHRRLRPDVSLRHGCRVLDPGRGCGSPAAPPARKLGKFRMIEGTKSLSSPTVFWEDYLEIFRRHQGSGALGDFFTFYYYNLARRFDGDLLQAIQAGAKVFERWHDLPESERAALGRDARRGQPLARVLLARDLQRAGAEAEAAAMLRQALAERPGLALRPAAVGVLFRRLLGRRGAAALDRCVTRAIRQYRRARFDYRYARGR